ncbi:MAG TPA: hypothetical protein VF546_10525 [Pyrinomonadaceae bacterium]
MRRLLRAAGTTTPIITRQSAAPRVARQAKGGEFPGFSQGDPTTCGATSLVSALMIWDRERRDSDAPNTLLVAACNAILVYMDNHLNELVRVWDALEIEGKTKQGRERYKQIYYDITAIRDAAREPHAQITEEQYQVLGRALHKLHKQSLEGGLSCAQLQQFQTELGIGAEKIEKGTSFDELLDKLRGLQPGQVAQVNWYFRGRMQAGGRARFTPHAFLVGRFQRGAWFMSDQGPEPPTEIEAPDFPSLKKAIRANIQTRGQGVHTGGLPTEEIVGREETVKDPDVGVMILGERGGVEAKAQGVIMKPGDFIAEVDASILRFGDRIVAGDFIARAYSLEDAKREMAGAGTGAGAVIVENPRGLFHVFKTSLVSEHNVMETSIDEGDSTDGKVTPSFRRFYHAWLQLRSASKTGSFFKVY